MLIRPYESQQWPDGDIVQDFCALVNTVSLKSGRTSSNRDISWSRSASIWTTISKQMAELSESLGFNFLDAPVAGSLVPAEKGELVFLVQVRSLKGLDL